MVDRRQRRALSAGRDIRRTEIVGNGDAQASRKGTGVADLPGPPPMRLMQDGLAVKADEVGCASKRFDRLHMIVGQTFGRAQQGADRPARASARDRGSSADRRAARRHKAESAPVRTPAILMPSVSSQAASTPSSEVPLIRSDGSRHLPSPRCVITRFGRKLRVSRHDDQYFSRRTRSFLDEATARGFVFQCTDTEALRAAMRAGPITAYIGFDCTADSLHVGSLVQIMILRLLQKHGHKPVVLLGGGTTRIGDPSGKDEARQLLTDETIAANMAGIRRCFTPFLRFGDGPSDAMLANNADWLDALGYIPLLRDVGIHFTINRMLGFDSVRLRLDREQPLTFLEFNYMILQSYDFRELSRRHGVTLQIGGSDQWGNIVAGMELTRRTDARLSTA